MHRTIVVGVDYSDQCVFALDEALRIAAANDAGRAVLIPVLVLPEERSSGAAGAEERVDRTKQNLARLVLSRASALGVTPPRTEPGVRFGDAAAGILDEARARGADLIAVGTHGRQGVSHLLLGSVAEEISRRASCSVLVARGTELPTLFTAGRHLPLELGRVDGTKDEIDQITAAVPAQVLSAPQLEAGQVVLHVLDTVTGQTFVCWFADAQTVRVEPLEREWVPHASPASRARALQAALDEVARTPNAFAALFAELDRRG
jgi:nucleotide-binding universal stress UspA family protein